MTHTRHTHATHKVRKRVRVCVWDREKVCVHVCVFVCVEEKGKKGGGGCAKTYKVGG